MAGAWRSESATRHASTGSSVAAGLPSAIVAAVIAQPSSRQSASPCGFHEPWLPWSRNSGLKFLVSKFVELLLTVDTVAWKRPAKCNRNGPR